MKLPPVQFINSSNQWREFLGEIRNYPRLAIDLESNSLYVYQEQVCLIQLSTPKKDYIIDPIAGLDLSDLGQIVQDPAVEKVLHAAEYDCILLRSQYGWQIENLFDTMWAARILGYESYGLANMLEKFFGVKQNKKYQKANWCRRPLSPAQEAYAQMDTHFLLRMRDRLAGELEKAGRMIEAREIFGEQTRVRPTNKDFDPEGYWSINGVREMTPRQQAIVRALYVFRDDQARRQNRPHFKIFGDKTLVELAMVSPTSNEQLDGIFGMSRGQIRRYGRRLRKVIREAEDQPTPTMPKSNSQKPPDDVRARYEKMHTWRKERAMTRGVESDVIISRNALWQIAWQNPQCEADLRRIDTLGPWRRQNYGKEILEILATTKARRSA